jgi:hypothetical protein
LKVAQDGFHLLLFSGLNPSGHYDIQFARRILRLLCIALSSRKHRSG